MSSNPSDLTGSTPLPSELADAFDRHRARLSPLASRIVYFHTIGSTNDAAAALIEQPGDAEGAVVIAAEQTKGRGRQGRNWFSPTGSGLYVSTVLVPARASRQPTRATMLLTLAAGVGIAEGVEAAVGLRVDLKWPNDLYVGRRKLGGILAEAIAPGRSVVLGFGINVKAAAYPPELADRATSLEAETRRAIDVPPLLVETLASLASRYRDLLDGRFDAILDAWRRRAPTASGHRVEWHTATGPVQGVTAGVDADGALLVETPTGPERIVAGEIIWF